MAGQRTRATQVGPKVLASLLRSTTSAALQRAWDDALAIGGDAGIVSAATRHRVAGLLHHRLTAHGVHPGGAAVALAHAHRDAAARHLVATRAAAEVVDLVPQPMVVVKGPVLAAHWYGDAGAREYSDLDVLIDRRGLRTVLALLESHGFAVLASNWEGFRRFGVAELPLARQGALTVDLHWHVVALAEDRRDLRMDVGAMLERRVHVEVGGRSVPTLDPEDTFVHLCVNAGMDGARRLRQLADVDVVVRRGSLEWDVVVRRSRAAGVHALVDAVVRRCRDVLSTRVSERMLRELGASSGWRIANAVVQRSSAQPTEAMSRGWLIQGGRATPWATSRALARYLGRTAMTTLGRPGLTDAGGALDWQRPAAPGDRERYLRWAQADRPIRATALARPATAHDLLAHLQPRSTPLLVAAMRPGTWLRGPRAWSFHDVDGGLAAVLVLERWGLGRWIALPVLLDPSAAPEVARRIDRSPATDLGGFERDVKPLGTTAHRWGRVVHATPASLPPGFTWGPPTGDTRRGTTADVAGIVDLSWRSGGLGYARLGDLRRWVRRAIDDHVVVLDAPGGDRIVGFAAREGGTVGWDLWSQIVIDDAWRGHGRSWDLVAAAAAATIARGAGALTLVMDTNPMSVPADSHVVEPWCFVSLGWARRFRGEGRLHALRARIFRGAPPGPGPSASYRTPGPADERVSPRRTQSDWDPLA